jgi:hypothetical protein
MAGLQARLSNIKHSVGDMKHSLGNNTISLSMCVVLMGAEHERAQVDFVAEIVLFCVCLFLHSEETSDDEDYGVSSFTRIPADQEQYRVYNIVFTWVLCKHRDSGFNIFHLRYVCKL